MTAPSAPAGGPAPELPEVPRTQTVVFANERGRILIMDSITFADERNNTGDVLVGASFAGVLAIRFPLRVRPRGVICHDAGIGKDRAGVAGLLLLEGAGIAGAAVATYSARVADGRSLYEDGVISVVNDRARDAGVREGMYARDAARRMLDHRRELEEVPKTVEVLFENAHGRILGMGSVTFATAHDHRNVICAGSHTGLTAAAYSRRMRPRGVICNDAGIGRDRSGIAGLEVLDEDGIPGASVDTMTACIGDGVSTYRDGVISAANGAARRLGIREGMPARDAAVRMLDAVRGDDRPEGMR